MTYKEKAAELFKKYINYVDGWNGMWSSENDYPDDVVFNAKQCALMEVRGIQQALIDYGNENHELQNMDRTLDWWNKVETEIENLP